jgi:mutator protein MutT
MSHERPARPVLGAAAVVIHDGRVVLIRRGKAPSAGEWSIPGGAVELGESVEAALRREVREETGLDIAVGRFLEVFERVEHDDDRAVRFHFVVLDYAATVISGTLCAGDDAADVALVDPADLDRYALADTVRRVISAAMQSTPAGRAGR